MVLVPGLDRPGHAIPFEDILVGILNDLGLQRDQRIRYLEGRGRQLRFARAHGVAGDDEIFLDLVADERALGPIIGEALRQRLADFAALRRNVGEGTSRQGSSGSEETEYMAAMDHERHPAIDM